MVTRKNPEMPHRGVKIGHLARESAGVGLGKVKKKKKNEKEGKIDVSFLKGTFFLLQGRDKKPRCLMLESC